MNARLYALITYLSDGRFHSGEQLGRRLEVSRAAVWKMISRLPDYGLNCFAISGRGYRLETPFEPLSEEQIRNTLYGSVQTVTVLPEVDSTNLYLQRAAGEGAESGAACVAEFQANGRGRRGRQWISPYGSNLYLSMLWRFDHGASVLAGLSLAIAVAIAKSLEEAGVRDVAIKWPNDIFINGEKVAGILLDVAGETSGPCHVVIGVGINYRMPHSVAHDIDQPWTDLTGQNVSIGRNRLAAIVLQHLVSTVEKYQECGLAAFHRDWSKRDLGHGKAVSLYLGERKIDGVASGIDEHGHLLLDCDGRITAYASGEVSLRVVMR